MNAFESGSRKLIPAVLVYLENRGRILMIEKKGPGHHQGKWNGLGGKMEADESALAAAVREIREEAGIEINAKDLKQLGLLHFPFFKSQKNEDWLVFIFRGVASDAAANGVIPVSDEGEVSWIPTESLLSLNLWKGDQLFLPAVLKAQKFSGTIWYNEGAVVRHELLF